MGPVLEDLVQGISHLVYPPNCLLCQFPLIHRAEKNLLCPGCVYSLALNKPPRCLKCSRPLPEPVEHPRCKICRQGKVTFDFAWAACPYDEPLSTLIHRFKYHDQTMLRHIFIPLLTDFIDTWHLDIRQFDRVIPVPLSATRFRERGYNQSQLLAGGIARKYMIPLNEKNLIRIRHTATQTALTQKERWTNLQGAFKINQLEEIKNKNILIIDDLLTTGSTASEAAHVLKSAGANTVGVLTLAITNEF